MKSNIGSKCLLAFGVLSLQLTVACLPRGDRAAPLGSEPSAQVSGPLVVAQPQLGFSTSGEDGELPATGPFNVATGNLLVGENEVEFKNVIFLPDPAAQGERGRPLFLLLEGELEGHRITHATFYHRVFGLLNRPEGKIRPADFLKDEKRWFFNVSRFFKGEEFEVDSHVIQIFELNLRLDNGETRTRTVRVRLAPPSARVERKAIPILPVEVGASALSGIRVAMDRMSNSSKTPVDIKVTLNAKATDLEQTVVLGVKRYKDAYLRTEAIVPVKTELSVSRSTLEVVRLLIESESEGGNREVKVKDGVAWIRLLGKEVVRVHWIAEARAEVKRCALPASVQKEVQVCGLIRSMCLTFLAPQPEQWFVAGRALKAKLSASLQISDLPEEQLEAVNELQSGEPTSHLSDFSCQGLF